MSWNMRKWMMLGSLASAALLVPACSNTNRGAADEEVAPVEMERGVENEAGTGGAGDVGMGGTGDAFDTSNDVGSGNVVEDEAGTGGTGDNVEQELGSDGQGVSGSENKADDAPGRTQTGGQHPGGH
jgi:hypothetical protein